MVQNREERPWFPAALYRQRQMLASPGTPLLEAAPLEIAAIRQTAQILAWPRLDMAPATDPIPAKRSAGPIKALTERRLDCGEPKKFQGRFLDALYIPDSLASKLARFADKDGELPENVLPEFRF
jgi:hypothetical protein